MKFKGSEKYINNQMSKFTTVFKKLNGKASEVAAAAVANKNGDSGNNKVGWSPEDLRKRRLAAFVKGIQVTGSGISTGIVNAINEFEINLDTFDYDNLTFDLYRVSTEGTLITNEMIYEMTELENRIKIAYGLDKPGQYVLDIKYLGLAVPSSPFKIEVRNVSDGKASAKDVVAFGKGLKKCLTGEISTFQLGTKKAGEGHISVATDGIKDIPLCVTKSKLGYTVQYVATSTGKFFLRVKLDGKHIPGSPFLINAEDRREVPENTKNLFKRGVLVGSKEKKNDLQP